MGRSKGWRVAAGSQGSREGKVKAGSIDGEVDRMIDIAATRARALASSCGLPVEQVMSELPHLSNKMLNSPPAPPSAPQLADYIDHTFLKSSGDKDDIKKLCKEAVQHGFKAVCVNSCWVKECSELLSQANSAAKVCTVVGFPLGQSEPQAKAFEAVLAVANGAQEIDMVINVGWLKKGEFARVYQDIETVVKAVPTGVTVKVILETCLLTEQEIIDASLLCGFAGADFVKTSTGFSTSGASLAAVRAMRAAIGDKCEIKASGGVRTFDDAQKYLQLGTTRIGTSSGVTLVSGGTVTKGY